MALLRLCILTAVFQFLACANEEQEEQVCAAGAGCGHASALYYWPKRGYHPMTSNSVTPHIAPSNFTSGPAWQWPNEEDELYRHAPSIDGQGNIFVVTSVGKIRKFSPEGEILWTWQTSQEEGIIRTCATLYEGSVFFTATGDATRLGHPTLASQAYAFSLDMLTGRLNWRKETHVVINGDSATVFVHNGTFVHAAIDSSQPLGFEGNHMIQALSSKDGSKLWSYTIDGAVWNFMPSATKDGTIVFATTSARAFCLNLANGQLVWKSGIAEPGTFLGTGGGVLGPNGVFYASGVYFHPEGGERSSPFPSEIAPCGPPLNSSDLWSGCVDGLGILIGYRASDGQVVLKKRTNEPGNQYPAIGLLQRGSESRLSIVLSLGLNPGLVHQGFEGLQASPLITWLPSFLQGPVARALFELQLRWRPLRRFFQIQVLQGSTRAFDAETGAEIWRFVDEPWDHHATAGDGEGFFRRLSANAQDARKEILCGPDSWGIPIIAGDGTVYASSGTNGNLYAIKGDADGDGIIGPQEVSVFRTGYGFLNAPALAPGMLVAAPCWGPMYVFKGN